MKAVCALVLLLAVTQSTNALYEFNCFLLSTQCGGTAVCESSDCVESGMAACPATEFNYDCGAAAESAAGTCIPTNAGPMPPPCFEAGTWECAGTDCTCREGYYRSTDNADCSLERVRAVCRDNDMDVYFAPYEGVEFSSMNDGAVYQVNDMGTEVDLSDDVLLPSCELTEDTTAGDIQQPGGLSVYSKKAFAYNAPPAGCVDPIGITGGGFRSFWYIQYGGTVSHNSVRVQIDCIPQAGNEVPAAVSYEFTAPANAPTESLEVEVPVTGIDWRLADPSTPATPLPAGTIPADDPVALVVDLTTTQVNSDFTVARFTAYNYDPSAPAPADDMADPPTYKSLSKNLISQTCAERWAGGGVLQSFEKVDASPELRIIVTFIPFVFNLQALGFRLVPDGIAVGTTWLQIELCIGTCELPIADSTGVTWTETACNPDVHIIGSADFPDLLAVVGRRRRRQVNDQPHGATVTSNMTVIFVGHEGMVGSVGTQTTRTNEDAANCHQTLTFLLPIVILAVMLVVVMAMTAFFCLKVSRSQGHPEGHTNMAYK